jgi:hypothetical protein
MVDMKKMMKQAQKMQRDAAAAQAEIASMEFSATAGGGMVEATVMGDMSVKAVKIDPEAVDTDDMEMLEDTIVAAVNEALRNASEASNARMSSIMGGVNLPF